MIKNYISNGFVTIIDYRGHKVPKNNNQIEAYYDCYEKHNKQYDWLSFFDIDEYLILKPKMIKIQNFLDNERYKNCPNIKINWLYYSDNNQIYYEDKPLTRRFPNPSIYKGENKHVKFNRNTIQKKDSFFHSIY